MDELNESSAFESVDDEESVEWAYEDDGDSQMSYSATAKDPSSFPVAASLVHNASIASDAGSFDVGDDFPLPMQAAKSGTDCITLRSDSLPSTCPLLPSATHSYPVVWSLLSSERDLCPIIVGLVRECCMLFNIPPAQMLVVLAKFGWNKEAINNRWWDDGGETVLRSAGLSQRADPPPAPPEPMMLCPITYVDVPYRDADALPCGHWCSKEAWRGYLASVMTEPRTVLSARCPVDGDCPEVVGPRLFLAHLPAHLLEKYREFIVRSFAENSKHYSFCHGPGCNVVLHYTSGGAVDVACGTAVDSHVMCYGCKSLGSHKPCSCAEAALWASKDSESGGSNSKWLADNTKGCPKCALRIVRSDGCNKMRCTQCNTTFCWMCLRHPFESAHDYPRQAWDCNKEVDDASLSEFDRELKKYAHLLDRAANHRESRQFILVNAPKRRLLARRLTTLLPMIQSDVAFLESASLALLWARDLCRWSYAHAYFIAKKIESLKPSTGEEIDTMTKEMEAVVSALPGRDYGEWLRIELLYRDMQGQLEGYVEVLSNLISPAEVYGKLFIHTKDKVTKPAAKKPAAVGSAIEPASAAAGTVDECELEIPPSEDKAQVLEGKLDAALAEFHDLQRTADCYMRAIRTFAANLLAYVEGGYDSHPSASASAS
jgi:hypothetical protein